MAFCYALLLWPSGLVAFWLKEAFWLKVVFCYGLLVWPSGVVAFCYGLLVESWNPRVRVRLPSIRRHQTRRPPNQKTSNQKATFKQKTTKPEGTKPEGHQTRRHQTRRSPNQKATKPEDPPGADTPPKEDPPRADTPLGEDTPSWEQTPPRSRSPLLWTEWQTGVKILPCPKLRLRAVKIFIIGRIAETCNLLCKRPGCYHWATKTSVTEDL